MDSVVAVAGEAITDMVPAGADGVFRAAPGGSPANVAVGLARLDVPARMLARLLRRRAGTPAARAPRAATASTCRTPSPRRSRRRWRSSPCSPTARPPTTSGSTARPTGSGPTTSCRRPGRCGGAARRLARPDHAAGRCGAAPARRPRRGDGHGDLRPERPASADGSAGRGARSSSTRCSRSPTSSRPATRTSRGWSPDRARRRWPPPGSGHGPALVVVTRGGDGALAVGSSQRPGRAAGCAGRRRRHGGRRGLVHERAAGGPGPP